MPDNYYFAPMGWHDLLFRLGIALIVGTIIGLERESKNKPAGLRTNMLVCFGSALLVLVPIEIGAAQQNLDVLGRIIAGIITGIGFIGGGTILRESKVKGLTSAATIWMSCVLGITIGCGLWLLGLGGALVTFIILSVFSKWEDYL
ncbi:MgtC/SapB transporter [Stanieria cyanosphaera PCC 7437]|uniref:MgtC/SapB transporter n=1 Tax=Stanieria cyanosphaera (strain ATCC 29371 / PCC 7437) TaxID=111780 RepID=K9XNQ4_STAC7|nr:MgtC/SapB family protein [Stanieria cyanosphaera]AFZ33714.1 MgtC/SapB transporter [Stanieria cyanosphaera PCC 7437]